jgi:sialic acid synthase SpsE
MATITLGGRVIGAGQRPYIMAEIGVNHGGSLELAHRLIRLAKQGGADAAKFQTYKAEKLASRHSPAYWDTRKEPTTSQFQLFQKFDAFGPDEYRQLAAWCREEGIDFVSTPFDLDAVAFLDPLVPFHKIASADVTNVPLLRAVAATGKPIVMSTGAATMGEVDSALHTLSAAGAVDIALLHCVLNYPTENHLAHLGMISGLRRAYPDRVIGYSDHTIPDEPMTSLTTAVILGATILEKHFTHDRTLQGNDHYHAMDVNDLSSVVARLELIQSLTGPDEHKRPLLSEEPARQHARRSIVVARAVKAGQVLSPDDLTCKRPGSGVSPQHWDEVIGLRAARDLAPDDVLQWRDLSTGPAA